MPKHNSFSNWLFSEHIRGIACAWLIVLSILGLQISMLLPITLNLSTTPFSITFKGICLLLALYLVVVSFARIERIKISKGNAFLLGFIVLYSIRFIYDISIRELHLSSRFYKGDESVINFYLYAFGAGFIPALAIILNAQFIQLNHLIRLFVTISCVQIACMLLSILVMFEFQISIEVLAQRYNYSSVIFDEEKGMPLNPIVVARFAGLNLVLIASTFLLSLQKMVKIPTLILLIFIFISIGLIFLGASRGPMLTMFVGLFVLILGHLKKVKINVRYILNLIPVILVLISLVIYAIINLAEVDLALLDRTFDFLEQRQTGVKEARDYQWESAYNQFLKSPVFGDKIFEDARGYYPHNIFLEILMSTGLIGLFFVSGALSYFGHRYFYAYVTKAPSLIFYIAGTVFLVANLFSGNLYQNPELWVSLSMCLSIPIFQSTAQKSRTS